MAMYRNGEEIIFKGYNACKKFCKFLFSDKHKCFKTVAHNVRGFDGQFRLVHLLKQGLKPKIIPDGSEIMKIKLTSLNINITDSFNFLPMGLARLPKTLAMEEITKRYFPHLFNAEENQTYVEKLPKKVLLP